MSMRPRWRGNRAGGDYSRRTFGIAQWLASDLRDGYVVNLGVGIPLLVPRFIPGGTEVILHAFEECRGSARFRPDVWNFEFSGNARRGVGIGNDAEDAIAQDDRLAPPDELPDLVLLQPRFAHDERKRLEMRLERLGYEVRPFDQDSLLALAKP